MAEPRFAAVDLGAQSGRVATGSFDGSRVRLELAHRFANEPLWLPDGLHWNLPRLFADVLAGLKRATVRSPLDGVGVDSWGVDYGLLGRGGRLLGLPFHYRDPVRCAPEVRERAFRRVSPHDLYARTGIQTMPINTVFQLVAEFADAPSSTPGPAEGATGSVALSGLVERIALIPDLFGLWLTGTLANELTNASTTAMLDAHGVRWATPLISQLGIPMAPFMGEVVAPGVDLGPVLEGHGAAGRAVGATVRTVASHDTASAFAATTVSGAAVLSSGTWSLLGVELDRPMLSRDAEAFNLTNERGIDDTTRLLKNVMGMWLIEQCRREWDDVPYETLCREAEAAGAEVPLFDPDDDSLLTPGAMSARIEALIGSSDQRAVEGRGELVRSILTSLACKYRLVLEQLEAVSGARLEAVQVVGGGVHNALLCRLTSMITGRALIAGPVEATSLGNVLVQLLATGEIGTRAELRELAARSVTTERFEPGDRADGEDIYRRFLAVTRLDSCRPSRAAA